MFMDYVTLGRTGLKASVMGLGAGGPSRIGKGTGKATEESVAVVRHALDNGINIIDTAEFYRTEKIVGEAIKGYDRESIILSTKKSTWGKFDPEAMLEMRRIGAFLIAEVPFLSVTPFKKGS